ncbi:MAG: hypothetical protein ACYDEQ_02240 [Desulfocucumaceae bacterium]
MENNVLVQNRQPLPGTVCIPSIKEVVCRWGAKCFHDIHYSTTYIPFGVAIPATIPPGACLQGLPTITNFIIVLDPLVVNGCCRVLVTYTIVAILVDANGLPIGVITKVVTALPLQIPIFDVPNVLCFGPVINHEPFVILFPRVYSATITTVNGVLTAVFRVEKEFGCFESRNAIVCQLECSPDEPSCTPPMPTPPTSPGCPTFTTPTVCFEFCVDDELFSPYNCDQCPPPQVFTDPAI